MPVTTRARISMVAKTGRRMQSCARACILLSSSCSGFRYSNGATVEKFAQLAGGDGFAAGDAGGKPNLIGAGILNRNNTEMSLAVADDEDLVRIRRLIAQHSLLRYKD